MSAVKTKTKTRKQKPLARIKTPLRATAYRAKFRPFEATKYLDVRALKRAKKAVIECGTLEVAGGVLTLQAEIRDGKIVALRPMGCESCTPDKARKIKSGALEKTMRALARKIGETGLAQPRLPMPLTISARHGLEIPIGPIIIVIGGDDGFDFCIEIWLGNELCWWCLFGPSACIDFGPPF